VTFYFGFILPQRYIRYLDWVRYIVTMCLVLGTVGVLIKMGARLVFNVKYILTLPDFSLNV